MIYGLGSSIVVAVVFFVLYIRSAIANGKIKDQNEALQNNVNIKQRQLDIAANHPDTPADLAKRLRDGTL